MSDFLAWTGWVMTLLFGMTEPVSVRSEPEGKGCPECPVQPSARLTNLIGCSAIKLY